MRDTSRRTFLKTAGVLAAANAIACNDAPRDASAPVAVARTTGFDKPLIDALSDAVLPETLGVDGRKSATAAFVAWVDAYDPVAEEMHGYGYADIRYLPSDPAPAWRAQLAGLDILARRSRSIGFAELDVAGRRELLAIVLRSNRGDRLPAPLSASHVAVALLSHWAASPSAHNLAVGARVTPLTCRPLRAAITKPAANT